MLWIVFAVAFLVAGALTAGVYRYALAAQLIDKPNERSSHSVPTPRGGGLAIVVTTIAGVLLLSFNGVIESRLALALSVGGGAVAFVGLLDDRGSLPVRIRILVHIGASMWAVYLLGGMPAMQIGACSIDLGYLGDFLCVFALVWALNLFNFMDGIDGIAASEAVFVAGAGAFIGYSFGLPLSLTSSALLLAASCLGFLVWNWPPAKIFMGDVGSGFLGYQLGVLAIAAAHENSVSLWVWITLFGVFFIDATLTLVRRLLRKEVVYQAHRSHAYQRLSRRWNSHRSVTLAVIVVNLLWLLPLAWLCASYPVHAWWILLAALGPMAMVLFIAGAGRAER